MDLESCRREIDSIDQQIVDLINQRARLAVMIGQGKRQSGQPVYAPHREAEVLARVHKLNQGPTLPRTIEAIYREIMSGSFALEQPIRVGYLGPPGTWSHLAASRHFGSSVDLEDLSSIDGVFEQVARGHIDYGLVPIENSTGGSINETLSALSAWRRDIRLYGELFLAVHCALLANCQPQDIKTIFARSDSISQCRRWLSTHFPSAVLVPVESSAAAARKVREMVDEAAGQNMAASAAAIANSLAGEIYGLHPLFDEIEDQQGNVTRFLILSRTENSPSTDDKTAIMFCTTDQPGALADVLGVFKEAGINLTHIEKCPRSPESGDYSFLVDAAGHYRDENLASAVSVARKIAREMIVLGSFPRSKQVL